MLSRRDRPGEAIPYLERAIGLNPRLPAVRNTLGGSYLAVGRREEGISQLRASLALVPEQPQIRRQLEELEGGGG